ncbi:MAG: ComF family protein [Flavobacteriales bacterium]
MFHFKKTVTESQTRKRFYARWENQENKFILTKKKYLNGKRIIIIDDVITSGSTMYNCISIFKKLEVRITVLFVANA